MCMNGKIQLFPEKSYTNCEEIEEHGFIELFYLNRLLIY